MNRIPLFVPLLVLVACSEGEPGLAGTDGEQGPTGEQGPLGDPGDPGPIGDPARVIDVDETWSGVEVIDGMAYVTASTTLTVDPGTTIEFLPGAGLYVDGVLDINGTVGSPVVLQPGSIFEEAVSGIFISGTVDATSIEWAHFERMDLIIFGQAATTLTGLEFEDGALRISDDPTGVTLSDITFSEVGVARDLRLLAWNVSPLTIQDSSFEGGLVGVQVVNEGVQAFTLDRSTFTGIPEAVLVEPIADGASTVSIDTITVDADHPTANESAVVIRDADATIVNADIGPATRYCLWKFGGGALTMSGSTLHDCEDGAAIVDQDATISDSSFLRSDFGLSSSTGLTATDITMRDMVRRGLWLTGGTVTNCTISDVGQNGIDVPQSSTNPPVTIRLCDIDGAGETGIEAGTIQANVYVYDTNVTNSVGPAMEKLILCDGCYMADNLGQTGADTTAGGTLDGDYQTSGTQFYNIDSVINPQSSPVTGAGAQ